MTTIRTTETPNFRSWEGPVSYPGNPLVLLTPPLPRYKIDPRQTALLVIDMQYMDAHREWGIGKRAKELGIHDKLTEYFSQVDSIAKRIRSIRRELKDGGGEVVYVALGTLTLDRRDASPRHFTLELSPQKGSKEAEILEELKPDVNDVVIYKTSASPFNSTATDQTLHTLGAKVLLVTGVLTNGCVESTVRDASDRSFQVIVVEDACAALTSELHANSIGIMVSTFANICTTGEVLEELSDFKAKVGGGLQQF